MVVLSILLALPLWAHSGTPDHSDLWVHLSNGDEKERFQQLGFGFVESQDGPWWRVHGETGSETSLDDAGIRYRYALPTVRMTSEHMSPEAMVTHLGELVDLHPDSARLVNIGTSVGGRPILAIVLGRSDYPEYRLRILGAHHGDETSSAEVSISAAETLLTDPTHTLILDTHEIWIVPHVNPDGIQRLSRYNDNNVDLNRNYGFEWSPTSFRSGDGPFSEPETRAIRSLSSWFDFGLGLSIHSGATNLGWVWNYTTERTSDEGLLSQLAEAYAEDCTTDDFWITNGADWYITNGDTTDWSYGRHGTLDYTLEVSLDKSPGPSGMDAVRDEHTQAIPAIIDWPWWVAGYIYDSTSGHPIMATITIGSTEMSVTTGHDGHFSRPVGDGSWSVTVSAPGYVTKTTTIATGEPADLIALDRSTLSDVWPSSPWISPDGAFELSGSASNVTLVRPGHQPLSAIGSETSWTVDAELLTPGPWTVMVDGQAAPNSLFVDDKHAEYSIGERTLSDTIMTIEIPDLGTGAKVWALWGDWRNPVDLPVLSESDDILMLDVHDTPIGDAPIDLVIWNRGHQIAVTNLVFGGGGDPEDDPDDESEEDFPEDSGDSQQNDTGNDVSQDDNDSSDQPSSGTAPDTEITSSDGKLKTSGCQASPSYYRGAIWLVSLLPLFSRRRLQ